jgi:hypothetical protein
MPDTYTFVKGTRSSFSLYLPWVGVWSMFGPDTLLAHGVAAPCLSDAAAGKMDDVLAANLFSGKQALCSATDWTRQWRAWLSSTSTLAPRTVVHGPGDVETDVELLAALDSASGSYGPCRLPWVSMYQTVHGRLSCAERRAPRCRLRRVSHRPSFSCVGCAPVSPCGTAY